MNTEFYKSHSESFFAQLLSLRCWWSCKKLMLECNSYIRSYSQFSVHPWPLCLALMSPSEVFFFSLLLLLARKSSAPLPYHMKSPHLKPSLLHDWVQIFPGCLFVCLFVWFCDVTSQEMRRRPASFKTHYPSACCVVITVKKTFANASTNVQSCTITKSGCTAMKHPVDEQCVFECFRLAKWICVYFRAASRVTDSFKKLQ